MKLPDTGIVKLIQGHRDWTSARRWLAAIIILAVALRLGAAFYLGDDVVPEPGVYDQVSYDELARRVLAGHGFSFDHEHWPMTAANAPTAHWSFLYTLYLAGVYALFGPHPLTARVIQAIVAGVLMPWLTYRLGRRPFGPAVGLAAAAISAVYVYFFYFGAALMTETFYILGILWTLDLAGLLGAGESGSRGAEEPGSGEAGERRSEGAGEQGTGGAWGRWALLGLAMGLTVLLRQTFLPVIGLVGLWLWWAARHSSSVIRHPRAVRVSRFPFHASRFTFYASRFTLVLLIVAALILPWTIRNYRVFNQFVLLNTNAGYAFFWANHPVHGTNFMVLLPPEIPYQSLIPPELRGLDEASLEKALMQRGIQFVLDDPGRYLLLSVSRLKDHFKFWPSPDSGLLSNLSRVGSFGLFLPFMLYGVWLAVRNAQVPNPKTQPSAVRAHLSRLGDWLRTPVALWLGFFALYTLMHLASWAGIRYRLPTDAVMVILAGLAVVDLWERLVRWREGSQGRDDASCHLAKA